MAGLESDHREIGACRRSGNRTKREQSDRDANRLIAHSLHYPARTGRPDNTERRRRQSPRPPARAGRAEQVDLSKRMQKAERAQPRYVARVSPSGKQNAYRLPLIVTPAVRHAPFDLALGDFPRRLVISEDLPTGTGRPGMTLGPHGAHAAFESDHAEIGARRRCGGKPSARTPTAKASRFIVGTLIVPKPRRPRLMAATEKPCFT